MLALTQQPLGRLAVGLHLLRGAADLSLHPLGRVLLASTWCSQAHGAEEQGPPSFVMDS